MRLSKPEEIEEEPAEKPEFEEVARVQDPISDERVPVDESLQRMFEHWQIAWDEVEDLQDRVRELEKQVRELGGDVEVSEKGYYDPTEEFENGE